MTILYSPLKIGVHLKSSFTLLLEGFHMDSKAADIKNLMTLNLLVQILEERGIMTDRELKERLTNNVKLSSMDTDLKEKVIEEIKH